jgi:hypothetical protein
VELPRSLQIRRRRRLTRRLRIRARVGFRNADRITLGLAALTALTAGTVLVGEFTRRFRRREAALDDSHDGAVETLQVAGRASRDTIRVALAGYGSASRHELVLFNLLSGFAGSFVVARVSTSGIRSGWWPFGNVRVGGRHIHHFVPGIVLAFSAGIAALLTDDLDRETKLAVPFGVGVGLTFDEAALLLDLRDVYWTRQGLLSVQLSLGGLALISGTIVALRMLRRGEEQVAEAGLIPDAELYPGPAGAA